MACNQREKYDSRHSEMTSQKPSDANLTAHLVENIFGQLRGTWVLDRRLQSANATEPAGSCSGSATFTSREPSVFLNDNGKLELASAEMVYHEEGHFEMQPTALQANAVRFPFSRKYVWRLQKQIDTNAPLVSIWFTKPGTEKIDYIFHKLAISVDKLNDDVHASKLIRVVGDGGHLCEEDIYSSSYTFDCQFEGQTLEKLAKGVKLTNWTMLHEVRGPNKDQIIETQFIHQ